ANTERMWQGLARGLGHPEWISDARFTTNKERLANKAALVPLIEVAFKMKTADEWIPILEAEEVPVGVVNTLDRVVKDPQLLLRNMVLDLESESGAHARVMGNPIKFTECASEPRDYPRVLGADTATVLGEVLNLSAAEVADLIAKK